MIFTHLFFVMTCSPFPKILPTPMTGTAAFFHDLEAPARRGLIWRNNVCDTDGGKKMAPTGNNGEQSRRWQRLKVLLNYFQLAFALIFGLRTGPVLAELRSRVSRCNLLPGPRSKVRSLFSLVLCVFFFCYRSLFFPSYVVFLHRRNECYNN